MPDTYDVDVVKEFDAPLTRVWAAWTEPGDLRQWWGPAGFTCPRAEVDVRPGGRILVTMRAPVEWGGFEQHSTWNITELEPLRRIRYVFNFTDSDGKRITPTEAGIPGDGVPADGQHEVVLTDLADRRTLLHMTERGYGTKEARDMSQSGLLECLDKMAALVEGAAD